MRKTRVLVGIRITVRLLNSSAPTNDHASSIIIVDAHQSRVPCTSIVHVAFSQRTVLLRLLVNATMVHPKQGHLSTSLVLVRLLLLRISIWQFSFLGSSMIIPCSSIVILQILFLHERVIIVLQIEGVLLIHYGLIQNVLEILIAPTSLIPTIYITFLLFFIVINLL